MVERTTAAERGRVSFVHGKLGRTDARMPDGRTQGLEIIGYDVTRDTFPMHAFDSHGAITIMQATADGDRWIFEGDALRFTGGFREDGETFAGLWEMKEDASGAWTPWMDLTLKREADR